MAARILIADSVATNRIALNAMLGSARYGTLVAADADTVLRMAQTGGVGLVLLDAELPGWPAETVLERLKRMPATQEIPIVVLTAGEDPAIRLAALRAGADDVMTKPVRTAKLLARIRSILRAHDTSSALLQRQGTVRALGFAEAPAEFSRQGTASMVSQRPGQAEAWCRLLAPLSGLRIEPRTIEAALAEEDGGSPTDLYMIDAEPGRTSDALRLLADLRSRESTRHAGILLIHGRNDADTAAMALDLGANDAISGAFDPSELALRLDIQLRRKREADRLRASVEEGLRLAVVDPLTGLFNRRYAMAHAKRIASGTQDTGYCAIVADIDRFKSVNDRFGHAAGDAVLTEIALRLRNNMRGMDMLARIGGEEFLVILPDTDPTAALIAARRLCAIVRETPVALPGRHPPLTVTISLGVALAEPGEEVEAVIERADRALYEAKKSGRDKATLSGQYAA